MPKIPGRKSTKTKVEVDTLDVGSFMMESETWLWRRECVVEGCDHRMGPDATKPGWTGWKSCENQALPAHVYDNSTLQYVGMACPCHVHQILGRNLEV